MAEVPFWERALETLNKEEWEALCDGCGRCCLHKLEDEETGELAYTNVACRLFDAATCRCTKYQTRTTHVPACLKLSADALELFPYLPTSCAYRLRAEGKPLAWWHPLISGDPATVVEAGISVQGKTVAEGDVNDDDLIEHLVDWIELAPMAEVPGPEASE